MYIVHAKLKVNRKTGKNRFKMILIRLNFQAIKSPKSLNLLKKLSIKKFNKTTKIGKKDIGKILLLNID